MKIWICRVDWIAGRCTEARDRGYLSREAEKYDHTNCGWHWAVKVDGAVSGRLIVSEWKYRNRFWTLAMDGDVDASVEKKFVLVPVDNESGEEGIRA